MLRAWLAGLFPDADTRAARHLSKLLELRGVDPSVIGHDALQAHAQVAVSVSRGVALTRASTFLSARDEHLEKMATDIADVLLGRRPLNRNIDGLLVAHAPSAALQAALKSLSADENLSEGGTL